jgi:hypothetical protein
MTLPFAVYQIYRLPGLPGLIRLSWIDLNCFRLEKNVYMKNLLAIVSGLLLCSLINVVGAAEIDRFDGKWKSKTEFQGTEVDITLIFKGKSVKFELGEFIVGTAEVTLSEHGGFKMLSLTDVQAGESYDSLNPVDADSKHVYSLGYRSFTFASNFESSAAEDPKLTVYKKVE